MTNYLSDAPFLVADKITSLQGWNMFDRPSVWQSKQTFNILCHALYVLDTKFCAVPTAVSMASKAEDLDF